MKWPKLIGEKGEKPKKHKSVSSKSKGKHRKKNDDPRQHKHHRKGKEGGAQSQKNSVDPTNEGDEDSSSPTNEEEDEPEEGKRSVVKESKKDEKKKKSKSDGSDADEAEEKEEEVVFPSEKSETQASSSETTEDGRKRRRRRVKKFRKIRVKRKKYEHNKEDDVRQEKLQQKYDEVVLEKEKREMKAANQAAFADFSAVGQTPVTMAKRFIKKMWPVIILGKACGRYPLQHKTNEQDVTYFDYDYRHPFAVYFLLSNIFLTVLFVAGTWSCFAFWLEAKVGLEWSPKHFNQYRDAFVKANKISKMSNTSSSKNDTEKDLHTTQDRTYLRNRPERYVYDRHIIFFLMTWCFLFHNVISGWHFWFEIHYIVKYFNFWIKATTTMQMDVTPGAIVPVMVSMGAAGIMSVGSVVFSALKALPSLVGMAATIAIILGRDFYPDLMKLRQKKSECIADPPCFGALFRFLYVVGFIIQGYLLMSAYFFVLLCLNVCKYLKNAFLMWNGRVYASLLRGGEYIHSKEGKSTYALLYKDHCVLLDLVEGTDRIFMYVIESYTGLSILSVCLEIYFIIRTAQKGASEAEATVGGFFVRPYDWIAGLLFTIQHGILLFMVLRMTAGVGEEAMAGLEIIRRKTMLGRKADEELYFMLSMFCSYTSDTPIALCAGGFIVCNKDYIIGVVATIISYFTLVIQFQPQLDFKASPDVDVNRTKIQKFIKILEDPLWEIG